MTAQKCAYSLHSVGEAVTIEADGVVVRLPPGTSVLEIVAVAAYLGRLA